MKRRKMDKSDSQPEVLVLPPKLLQSLGITLGNIEKVQEPAESNKIVLDQYTSKENEYKPPIQVEDLQPESLCSDFHDQNDDSLPETSIMKTANLMKKSVFLSPTFCHSNTSTTSSIRDISTPSTETDITIDKLAPQEISSSIIPLTIRDNSDEVSKGLIQNINVPKTQKSEVNNCDETKIVTNITSVVTSSIPKQKINVISEEIIGPDKLNFMQIKNQISSNTNTFIPVPIDSVITKAKIYTENKADMKDITSNTNVNISPNRTQINLEENPNQLDHEVISDNKLVIITQSVAKLATSEIATSHNVVMNDQIDCSDLRDGDVNSNNNCIQLHIPKKDEIPVSNKNYKSSKGNDEAKEGGKNLNDNIENKKDEEPIKPNHHTLQTKLYIQGVEKPGGLDKLKLGLNTEKNPKTYIKPITKTKKVFTNNVQIENSGFNEDCTLVENQKMCAMDDNFCACSDFGKFNYYDLENCEHIHFGPSTVQCSLDDILSIYYEVDKDTNQNIVDPDKEITQSDATPICFNDFAFLQNKDENDLSIEVLPDMEYLEQANTVTQRTISKTVENKHESNINKNQNKREEVIDNYASLQNKDENELGIEVLPDMEYLEEPNTVTQPALSKTNKNKYKSNINKNQNKKDEVINNYASLQNKDENELGIEVLLDMEHLEEPNTVTQYAISTTKDNKYESKINKNQNKKEQVIDTYASLQNEDELGIEVLTNMERLEEPNTITQPTISKNKNEVKMNKNHNKEELNDTFKDQRESDNITEIIQIEEIGNSNESNIIHPDENHIQDAADTSERKSKKRKRLESDDIPLIKKVPALCDICNKLIPECDLKEHKNKHSKTTINDRKNLKMKIKVESDNLVICAICKENIEDKEWIHHIAVHHKYLAWKDTDYPLDFTDRDVLERHFNNILKLHGSFVCKCGQELSDLDSYLSHVNTCDADAPVISKCGVCEEEVSDWYEHIGTRHNYLACRVGYPSVDLANSSAVWLYLTEISRKIGGLVCPKCKCRRKYTRAYWCHIEDCNKEIITKEEKQEEEAVICGVCRKNFVKNSTWYEHISKEHNYLAWTQGDSPMDFSDTDVIYKHLDKMLEKIKSLVCGRCGIERNSTQSYLSHINNCDVELSELSKCGVCEEEVSDWYEHIGTMHNYLACRVGIPKINFNDEAAVWQYLTDISRKINGLVCAKCNTRRKYTKAYLEHIKVCDGQDIKNASLSRVSGSRLSDVSECDIRTPQNKSRSTKGEIDTPTADNSIRESTTEESAGIICGVCKETVEACDWLKHIQEKHNYVAWRCGETPINKKDDEEVKQHLLNIVQKYGCLTCKYCGVSRKYPKSFLGHMISCEANLSLNMDSKEDQNEVFKCGVCQKETDSKRWPFHLQSHNYMAWKENETPLDTTDVDKINAHLYDMSKIYNGLTCPKCGVVKKYVKAYRGHIENCDSEFNVEEVIQNQDGKDTFECAICHEEGPMNKFSDHAMTKHYNVAWKVGEFPINVRSNAAIEKQLKEYRRVYKTLKCLNCGLTRASLLGFFAHVVSCGRSEEETDQYKNVCELCNSKYLGIYKYQHMLAHRVQEAKCYREEEQEIKEEEEEPICDGKRRAAQKAKKVIEKFKVTTQADESVSDEEDTFKCPEEESSSESDESGEVEQNSDELEGEDVSDTESRETPRRRGGHGATQFTSMNINRIPFSINDPDAYIHRSMKDFSKNHLSLSGLFPQWLTCDYEVVSDAQLPKYLPPLTESCNVKFSEKNWSKLGLFEAKYRKGVCMFVGACVQTLSWVPCDTNPYLAVNCHYGTDAPRLEASQVLQHAALIQIWDFKNMKQAPSLVLGIAHDYGTVWAMDWCPSGVCEVLPKDIETPSFVRLGLLSVACSNGFAYIFSVPHPSSIVQNEKFVYKLKPVAELRLFRDINKKVQATAINWSSQKGHTCIIVGYANGKTAMYDLQADSPLLTLVEDGVKIYYPFYDDKPLPASITDVKAFIGGEVGAGALSASSPCGVAASLGGAWGERAGSLHMQLTAARLVPIPHWPAPILVGNSDIITQAINEMEWWGCGRRLGSVSAACSCAQCARLAALYPPLLKTCTLHPAYKDKKDVQVKARIDIMPLIKENSTDTENNSVPIEPTTYEESVELYGIEFDFASDLSTTEIRQRLNKPKRRTAERYPLADVTSMAFCPIPKYHHYLAVATHAGIIFVITT